MIIFKITKPTRTIIVAALMAYGEQKLATAIGEIPDRDPADDGPEVDILRETWRGVDF
jgi:hypothetical protein